MKKSAFTLIELLVVISIIAILASIAVPVFGGIQERAAATKDLNNLKQIGTGLLQYLNDNDDQMFSVPGGGAADSSWPKTLHGKYVPSWAVFRSPFDKETSQRKNKESAPGAPVSYGINLNCMGVSTSKFVAPSQLIVMAPAMDPGKEIKFSGLSESNPTLPQPGGGGSQKLGTHSRRTQINALYADSHVSGMPYREYASIEQEEGMRRWFPEGEQPQPK